MRTVVGGAGLMLATVATTAAAKPLAATDVIRDPTPPPPAPLPPSEEPPSTTTATPPATPPPPPPPPTVQTSAPALKPATDQLGEWINEAVAILEADGYSSSKLNVTDIRLIVLHESGGNPYSINNWDANAANGTPSKGLMQLIGPTFLAYALPGHTNIWNPVDNIVAGVRYIIANYGSVANAPGVVSELLGEGYRGY